MFVPGGDTLLKIDATFSFGEFVDEASGIIREPMEGAATLNVPLTVEVGTGSNWDEAH